MPRILSPLSFALIATSLPQALLSEEATNDGYPAPPGVYGQAEILKNTHLNLGTGSPYVIFEDQAKPAQPQTQTQSVIQETEKNTDYSMLPARSGQTAEPPFRPAAAQQQTEPYPSPDMQNPYQSSVNTRLPVHNNVAQAGNYPDATEVMQQYQEAKQLPFDQWGGMPMQNSSDYGYTSVPINASPQPMVQQKMYQAPYDNPVLNYNNAAPVSRSSQSNYSPNRMDMPYQKNWQSQYFNPGYMMDQFFGERGYNHLAPPSSSHLKTFEQFPVPHMTPSTSFYGVPGSDQSFPVPGSNMQFMHRIPEEDIIYPPSYPGRR